MLGRRCALAGCLTLTLVMIGCRAQDPATAPPLRMTKSGACGEAYFWATTESGDTALTVTVDARNRPVDKPTKIPISVPDPAIQVEILTGHDLARNFCTDLPDSGSDPSGRQPATAGAGDVTLAAIGAPASPTGKSGAVPCGSISGTLRLSGLVAKDGTRFEPVEFTSFSIGCYAG